MEGEIIGVFEKVTEKRMELPGILSVTEVPRSAAGKEEAMIVKTCLLYTSRCV